MVERVEKFELVGDGIKAHWSDGGVCVFPYRLVRLSCRCAHCEDEMTHERRLVASSVPDDIIAVELLDIGNYGVQILWSDGHEAGIFTFEMLWNLALAEGLLA